MEAASPAAPQTGPLDGDPDEMFSPQAQLEALLQSGSDRRLRTTTTGSSGSGRIGAGPERVLEKHRKQKLLVERLRKALVRTRLFLFASRGTSDFAFAVHLRETMSIVCALQVKHHFGAPLGLERLGSRTCDSCTADAEVVEGC